jgi:hypothetical protein
MEMMALKYTIQLIIFSKYLLFILLKWLLVTLVIRESLSSDVFRLAVSEVAQ